jgi:tRNA nucleotidyltransferase (CCA-adding enzyme)
MLSIAEELQLEESAPKPIRMGRHLIALGLRPEPKFGKILSKAFDAQLDGQFSDVEGGLRWVQKNI